MQRLTASVKSLGPKFWKFETVEVPYSTRSSWLSFRARRYGSDEDYVELGHAPSLPKDAALISSKGSGVRLEHCSQ